MNNIYPDRDLIHEIARQVNAEFAARGEGARGSYRRKPRNPRTNITGTSGRSRGRPAGSTEETIELRNRVVEMRSQKISFAKIALEIDVSKARAHQLFNEASRSIAENSRTSAREVVVNSE